MLSSIENYIEAWNSLENKIRLEKLRLSFCEDGQYLDAHVPTEIQNLNLMNSLIQNFRGKFKHDLILTKSPEFHHSVFRFHWKLQDKDSILSKGVFFGEFDNSNLIKRIVGFVDL